MSAAAVAMLAPCACMTTPHNDMEVANRSSQIDFDGYLWEPEENVRLEAQWPNNRQWFGIPGGTAQSDDRATTTWFSQPLFRWVRPGLRIPSWAWDPGAVGYSARVRGKHVEDGRILTTFDDDLVSVVNCKNGTSSWNEFVSACASRDNGVVTVRTADFVPDVSHGETSCSTFSDGACSTCIPDVVGALSESQVDISSPSYSYEVVTGSAPSGSFNDGHIQGVVRLRDAVSGSDRVGRIILTHNLWHRGLSYAEHREPGGVTAGEMVFSPVTLQEQYELDITADYDHPGGAQAHGDWVAVGMEGGGQQHGAVDFFQFPQNGTGRHVNRLLLDGSRGEAYQVDGSKAAGAAFVKLDDGRFLVAVAGRSHGTEGIAFYRSDRDRIEADTQWEFISHWTPSCAELDGSRLSTCFGGVSSISLVTQCDGSIFLVALNGSDTNPGSEYQWSQVFAVSQDAAGDVQLEHTSAVQRDSTGTFQTNNNAFRWGSGVYVTDDGRPVLMNTERRTNNGANDRVDGHLFY